MMAKEKLRDQVTKIHVKSVIPTRICDIEWTVENYSKFPKDTLKLSPVFTASDYVWQVGFATGRTVSLSLQNNSMKILNLECNVMILDDKKKVLYNSNNSNPRYYIQPNQSSTIVNLTSANYPQLTNLFNDKLILKYSMKFYEDVLADSYVFKSKTVLPIHNLEDLSLDLKAMLASSRLADISLSVGDDVLRVHKFVLCARSKVFAKMIESGMLEAQEKVIHIVDLDLPVLKNLIDFMYTGIFDEDFETVCSLYYAADKYDIPNLKKTCGEFLLSNLEKNNACRLLMLADRHNDPDFKNSVIGFTKFHYDEVPNLDDWGDLVENAPKLAAEIFKNDHEKLNDDKDNTLCIVK